jgi:hypothetical protein
MFLLHLQYPPLFNGLFMLKWIYWQTKEALSIHLIQVFFPHPFKLLQVPLQVHLPEQDFDFIEVFRCADAVEFLVFALQGPKEQGGQSGIFLNSEKRYCQMPSKEIWKMQNPVSQIEKGVSIDHRARPGHIRPTA